MKPSPRKGSGTILVKNAFTHNLKNISPYFKSSALNIVTGVSGAGKSSLVFDTLSASINKKAKGCDAVTSDIEIKRIIKIDQSPIGRTPRSNPATYTGLFDLIRDLMARQELAQKRKYKKAASPLTIKRADVRPVRGREALALVCICWKMLKSYAKKCNGQRYNPETLQVKYKEKNIAEILELSVNQAIDFFQEEKKNSQHTGIPAKLGVGYLSLGQSSTKLSGGEAQRVKLASELHKIYRTQSVFAR